MSARMAEVIRLRRHGAKGSLSIDGEPFPWAFARDVVAVDMDGMPGVTITLMARRVEVVNVVDSEVAAEATEGLRP